MSPSNMKPYKKCISENNIGAPLAPQKLLKTSHMWVDKKQQHKLNTIFPLKILSKTVARKIRHLVAIRIGMNKMAEGDEYLDYHDEILEQAAKPWSASLGVFFETKWWVLNALKLPHRTGKGKTGNPQSQPSRVSSLSSSQQRGARLKL